MGLRESLDRKGNSKDADHKIVFTSFKFNN